MDIPVLRDVINVQCDDGAHQEVVPDVFPVIRDHIDDQLACNEYELRKGGTVPEDERVSADGGLEDDIAQRERTKVWKMQLSKGQP